LGNGAPSKNKNKKLRLARLKSSTTIKKINKSLLNIQKVISFFYEYLIMFFYFTPHFNIFKYIQPAFGYYLKLRKKLLLFYKIIIIF